MTFLVFRRNIRCFFAGVTGGTGALGGPLDVVEEKKVVFGPPHHSSSRFSHFGAILVPVYRI
jgi:hypothetical protein